MQPDTPAKILKICWLFCVLILAGCATWNISRNHELNLPETPALILIQADFELPKDSLVIKELNTLSNDLSNTLDLELNPQPVQVRLFSNSVKYQEFVKQRFPQLANRRAIFAKATTGYQVYSQWSDNILIDLRHETTHAYLNATIEELPLWLDEGLAEYFEISKELPDRINPEHLNRLNTALLQGAWKPSLERIAAVTTSQQMQATQYAEAWLWVHFLIHQEEEGLLKKYLKARSDGELVDPLMLQVRSQYPQAEQLLIAYLNQLKTD